MYSLRSLLLNAPLCDVRTRPNGEGAGWSGHAPFATDGSIVRRTRAVEVPGLDELVLHLFQQRFAREDIPLVDIEGGRGLGNRSKGGRDGSEGEAHGEGYEKKGARGEDEG